MRKSLFACLLFCSQISYSQEVPDYDKYILHERTDYKAADSIARKASTYLLSTPFKKDNIDRLRSIQFMIRWMSGTPDYNFNLDQSISSIIKGNDELLALYMAAMTKYVLENPALAKDEKLVKINSVKLLLAYCENPVNNIKMTKALQKLSQANQKGELEKVL